MKPIFTTNNNKKKKKLTYTGTQTEMQRETQTQTYTQTERQHIHTHRRAYMTDLRLLGPAGGVCPCRRLNVVFSCGDGSAARISCRRPPAPQQHSVHTPRQQHLLQEAPCTTTTFSPHSMATTSPAGGPLHHNNIQSTLHGNNISCRRPPAPQQLSLIHI